MCELAKYSHGFASLEIGSVDNTSKRNHEPNRFKRKKRGPMSFRFITAAAVILAASLTASCGYAQDVTSAKKHTATKKAKTLGRPTVEERFQALRQELDRQAMSNLLW